MAENRIMGRAVQKHDIEENWEKASGFVPMKGELIVYDPDANHRYPRLKIGDGETSVDRLPFAAVGESNYVNGLQGSVRHNQAVAENDPYVDEDYMLGVYASALGAGTKASGDSSFAEGANANASGEAAHAEGNSTVASGSASHAEGYSADATGVHSHAEGTGTTASGHSAHAEGNSTTAEGECAHAEGYGTLASGEYSHTEGANTLASSSWAHAEGSGSHATSPAAHAEGAGTRATGESSHSEGDGSTASGYSAHAEGLGTISKGRAQHVHGRYNIEDTESTYAHIVGNGDGYNARSNAHTLDWDGNAWFQGDVYVGGAAQTDTSASKLISQIEMEAYVNEAILGGAW